MALENDDDEIDKLSAASSKCSKVSSLNKSKSITKNPISPAETKKKNLMRLRKDSLIPEKLKKSHIDYKERAIKLFEVIRCPKPPQTTHKFDFSGLTPVISPSQL